jgi:hypothetical protein
MLRRVLAVIAAPIVWGVIMFPGNLLLLSLFPGSETTPTTGYLLAALLGAAIYSIVAGMATAAIAGARPMLYGTWGSVMLVVVGIVVQWQYRDALPLWYHLSFLALLIPACIAGAWWYGRR